MNFQEYTNYHYSMVITMAGDDALATRDQRVNLRRIIQISWIQRDFVYRAEYDRILEFMKVWRILSFDKKIVLFTPINKPTVITNNIFYRSVKRNNTAQRVIADELLHADQQNKDCIEKINELDQHLGEICGGDGDARNLILGNDISTLAQLKIGLSKKIIWLENEERHRARFGELKNTERLCKCKRALFIRTFMFSAQRACEKLPADMFSLVREYVGEDFIKRVRQTLICAATDTIPLSFDGWRLSDLRDYCESHIYIKYGINGRNTDFTRETFSKFTRANLVNYLVEKFGKTFEFVRDISILHPLVKHKIQQERAANREANRRRTAERRAAAATNNINIPDPIL